MWDEKKENPTKTEPPHSHFSQERGSFWEKMAHKLSPEDCEKLEKILKSVRG